MLEDSGSEFMSRELWLRQSWRMGLALVFIREILRESFGSPSDVNCRTLCSREGRFLSSSSGINELSLPAFAGKPILSVY
jgi:hypothetical protein